MNMMSDTIGALAKALAAAQSELQPALKNARNPHLHNRYADLSAVYEAVRDVLPRHGLAVAQTMLPADGKAHVRTWLMHESGEWLASECLMPLDHRGGPQGMGSAITYARRYSLSAIIGVVSEDDDDAEAAQGKSGKTGGRPPTSTPSVTRTANTPDGMTPAQSSALMAYLTKRHGNNREAYLAELSSFFGREISSSRELTKDDVSEFLDAINRPQQEIGNGVSE